MTPNARQESKNNDETKQPTRENNSIADKRIVSLSSFHSIQTLFVTSTTYMHKILE
jgi:hypothetical protein